MGEEEATDETLDSIEETIVVGTDALDDGALLLDGDVNTLVDGATELAEGCRLDAVDGVTTRVVGAELTSDTWLLDGFAADVVGVTTFVSGLLTGAEDDTLDFIDVTIVVGTDTPDDGAILLDGDVNTLVDGATELLEGCLLDAVDGVTTRVVGAELTSDTWLLDGFAADVVGVTTFVFGLLTGAEDDTLDSIDVRIVVGTDTPDDGVALLDGDLNTLVDGATFKLDD